MSFVYHVKTKSMEGSKLLPLNKLKDSFPDKYELYTQKYKGREHLLKKQIPLLGCLWNDVIHLAPIHPSVVYKTMIDHGLLEEKYQDMVIEVYKIPVHLLDAERTVSYQSYNYDRNNFQPDLQKFCQFEKNKYTEQLEVSDKQIEIWKNDKAANKKLMLYSHTQHILTQTEIDISSLDIEVFNPIEFNTVHNFEEKQSPISKTT